MIGQAQLTKLRDRNPKVSKKLAAVIEKALSPEGKDRYQSAAEFKQALLEASDTVSRKVAEGSFTVTPAPAESGLDTMKSAPPAGPTVVSGSNQAKTAQPGKRSSGLVFGLIGLALVVVVGGLWLGRGAISNLLSSGGDNNPPVTTEDVSSSNGGGGETAATATTGSLAAVDTETPLPEAATDTPFVEATPNGGGAQLAFASMRNGTPQIYLIDLPTGEITQLTDINGGACQPTWSPNGMQLVFISPCNSNKESYAGSGLFIMNADGSGLSPLPSSPAGDFDPDWSPVEDKIIFTSLREGGRPNIFVMDLSNRGVTNLSGTVAHDYQPSWSPDGSVILFVTTSGGTPQVWFMDPSGRSTADIFSRTNSLSNSDPFWSPDGLLVLFTQLTGGSSSRPQLMGADWKDGGSERGFNEVQIVDMNAGVREADYSPDGFWLVFVSAEEAGNFDIFIARSTGSGIERITTDPAPDFDPAWRPNLAGP
jgi:Tol biopolymer transport system component